MEVMADLEMAGRLKHLDREQCSPFHGEGCLQVTSLSADVQPFVYQLSVDTERCHYINAFQFMSKLMTVMVST